MFHSYTLSYFERQCPHLSEFFFFMQLKFFKKIKIFKVLRDRSQKLTKCQNFTFAQLKGLELRKENLNAANIYLSGINLTKCKYIDRSFLGEIGNCFFSPFITNSKTTYLTLILHQKVHSYELKFLIVEKKFKNTVCSRKKQQFTNFIIPKISYHRFPMFWDMFLIFIKCIKLLFHFFFYFEIISFDQLTGLKTV